MYRIIKGKEQTKAHQQKKESQQYLLVKHVKLYPPSVFLKSGLNEWSGGITVLFFSLISAAKQKTNQQQPVFTLKYQHTTLQFTLFSVTIFSGGFDQISGINVAKYRDPTTFHSIVRMPLKPCPFLLIFRAWKYNIHFSPGGQSAHNNERH